MLGSADTNAILSHVQDSKISNGFVYQSKNIKLLPSIVQAVLLQMYTAEI